MRKYLILVALVCYFHQAKLEEVRLLDLEPNEAENIIGQQDQTLKYAPKIDSNVPAIRFLGKEPHNVLEDLYLAKQYHGQDGLGGYLYGYQVPDIAKNEEKKASGDLKGAYNYINGDGQEIRVEYWDNGDGFHQTDNIPEVLPQQVEDSPEVKAAKDVFFKRWQEEAERNTQPIQSPYNKEGQYASGPLSKQGQKVDIYNHYQGAASGPQPAYAQRSGVQQQQLQAASGPQPTYEQQSGAQQQQPQAVPVPQPSYAQQSGAQQQQPQAVPVPQPAYAQQSGAQQQQPQAVPVPQPSYVQQSGAQQAASGPQPSYAQQSGAQPQQAASGLQPSYALQSGAQQQQQQDNEGAYNPENEGKYIPEENEESNGPPKGFFYAFDYPVGIITQDQGRALPVEKSANLKNVYEENKQRFERQLQQGGANGGQYLIN